MAIPTPSINSISEASSVTSFIITSSLLSSEQDTLYLYKGTSDNPTDLYDSYSVSQDDWLKIIFITNNIGNTKYYYRARCSYNGIYGNYSSTVSSITAPSAVYASLLNNTKTSATFSISCSSSGSALTTYLKYSIKVAGGTESVVDTGLTNTQGSTITYTVNNLSPNSNYVVTFYLENDSGKGMSSTVTFSTSTFYGPKSGYQTSSVARSNFTLSDTSNMGLYSKLSSSSSLNVKMYGDTYQTTYTGKNLLKLRDTSTTVNGITFTPNADGSFNLSGTAGTGGCEFSVVVPLANSGIENNTKYTITSNGIGNGISYFVHSCQSNGTWVKTLMKFSSNNQTLTCPEPTTDYIKFVIFINAGSTISLSNIKTQIEKGSTATSFEPYTAGASPNPDYPQEVQTVTGLQTIDITGSNGESQEYEINLGKNLLNVDSSFTVTNSQRYREIPVSLKAGETYTYSFTGVSTNGSDAFLVNFPGTGTNIYLSSSDKSHTFTLSKDASKVYIYSQSYWAQSANATTTFTNIMIEKGSTVTSYASYFEPIELCKIGDYQDYIYKQDGDWYLHKEFSRINLAIADMNNSTNYPGWSNTTETNQLKSDAEVSGSGNPGNLYNLLNAPYITNIKGLVAVSTSNYMQVNFNSTNSLIFLNKNIFGLTQEEWTAQYPNLVVNLYYRPKTPTDTKITNSALIVQLNKFYLLAHAYPESTTFSTRGDLPILLNGNFPYTDGTDTSEKIVRMYGSVDGKTKRIKKLYGSVNGKTKLILNNS